MFEKITNRRDARAAMEAGVDFTLANGDTVKLTWFRPGKPEEKIFIHSDFISGEWPIKAIGVMVIRQPENVHVKFMPTDGAGIYSGWFFDVKEYDNLMYFFRVLGFPLPNSDPSGLESGAWDNKTTH